MLCIGFKRYRLSNLFLGVAFSSIVDAIVEYLVKKGVTNYDVDDDWKKTVLRLRFPLPRPHGSRQRGSLDGRLRVQSRAIAQSVKHLELLLVKGYPGVVVNVSRKSINTSPKISYLELRTENYEGKTFITDLITAFEFNGISEKRNLLTIIKDDIRSPVVKREVPIGRKAF